MGNEHSSSGSLKLNTALTLIVTIFSGFCAVLMTFGVSKLDTLNTSSIQQRDSIQNLSSHVSAIDNSMKEMVTRSEFNAALQQRDNELLELKKSIQTLSRRLATPGSR